MRPDRGRTAGERGDELATLSGRGPASPPMKRFSNLEGAFPLLLVGGALLVYAAIIANQEIAAHATRLPLWGLIGAVGVVIAGAGVYSTFLEGPPTIPSAAPPDSVTIPKSEYEALRVGRPIPPKAAPPPEVPDWWEGPPEPSVSRPSPPVAAETPEVPIVRPLRPAPSPPARRPSPTGSTPNQEKAGVPVLSRAPVPAAPGTAQTLTAPRASLRELKSALSELETLLDREFASSSRTLPKPAPKGIPACADCRRALPKSPTPNDCSGCGRSLCNDCALSSQFEDGDLRCIECRARDPWPRRPSR